MTEYKTALDKAFENTVKNKNQAAINAVVFDGENILYEKYEGLLDKKKKIETKEDALFMIGSNTKVLTALGIFRLLEDGKLELEDPITKFIPEFSIRSNIGEYPITIENVLMHRGGIQCDLYEYIIGKDHVYTDIIDSLRETYLTSIPGTMFSYSNLGYTLLGIVEERVSGMKYADFIKENIADPLGMEIYFSREEDLPEEVSDRIARSFNKKGTQITDPLGILFPAGSNTYTTIASLVKVGQLLMNDGRFKDLELYKPETIQRMKSLKVDDVLDEELACVGYGLFHHALSTDYVTGRILGHGGDTMYHHSAFDFLPEEKIGVIVFTNFEKGAMLSRKILSALLNAYLKEAGFPKKEEKKSSYLSFDPKDYVSTYDSVLGEIELKEEKGQLTTVLQKIPVILKKDKEGWLCVEPKPLWIKATPLSKSFKGMRIKPVNYYSRDVLLLEQNGSKQAFGEKFKEPGVSHEWLNALGTYKVENKDIRTLISKMSLELKGGSVVIVLTSEGRKMYYYLDVIDNATARVRGFGRNTNQTVFLKKSGKTYELSVDGVTAVRK